MSRSLFFVWSGLLLGLFVGGCSGSGSSTDPDAGNEPSFDPSTLEAGETGPYRVGVRIWDITYTTRYGEERTIPISVYYPTEDEHDFLGDPPTMHPSYANGLYLDIETIIDATPIAPVHPSGRFPLLAHSHGHQGVPGAHYLLFRHFASHGWASVSVGHVGNRLIDGPSAGNTPLEHWIDRPDDVRAALDAIEALDAEDPLSAIDTSRVLSSGFSRGSYTPWALAGVQVQRSELEGDCEADAFPEPCEEASLALYDASLGDDRIVAMMPVDGDGHSSLFGGYANMSTDLPVLYFTAGDADRGMPLFAGVPETNDLRWVGFAGGCHQIFNLPTGGECDADRQAYGDAAYQSLAMAFARTHILGEENAALEALLDGTTTFHEDVVLMIK